MNPLELRRRMLVAESELNRSHAIEDCAELTSGVRLLAARARSFGSLLTSVQVLFTATAALQRGRSTSSSGPASWLQTILKGAGFVSTVWLALRKRRAQPAPTKVDAVSGPFGVNTP